MKRQLFLMAIMAICSATTLMAQGIVRTGIYMQDGTMHFVHPTTDLHVKLTVEHSQFVLGEYARYAQSMLGVRASLAARSSAKITEVSIEQGKAMAVVPCADSDEGASVAKELPTYRLDNRSMTVEQQAQAAADMIFALRRHRKELITGEAGENVFGAGLAAALEKIAAIEKQILDMFYGTTTTAIQEYRYTITPTAEQTSYTVCRYREDEGVVEWLMEEYGDELESAERVDIADEWGVMRSDIGVFQCFHFYPHKARGEGFFAAIACKKSGATRRVVPKSRRKVFAQIHNRDLAEVSRWVDDAMNMSFRLIGDTIYGYNRGVVDDVVSISESLSVVYSGVAMGQIFKGRLKPEHPLSLFIGCSRNIVPRVDLSKEDALNYLRRQDIPAGQFDEGINIVEYGGVAIGFIKRIGARCNNMYPKDLRIIKL